jgi:hypothetical protein
MDKVLKAVAFVKANAKKIGVGIAILIVLSLICCG